MFLLHSWSSLHPPCSWLRYVSHHWHIFVHSRLDCCNSMYYCLSKSQLKRLQHPRMLLLVLLLQLPGSVVLTIFSDLCTDSRYRNVSNTKLFPPYISSSSLFPLFHGKCTIPSVQTFRSTRSSTLFTHLQLRVQSSPKITNGFISTCCTSLVELASSYFLYSLLVWSAIITQLFSIVRLWSLDWFLTFLMAFPTLVLRPAFSQPFHHIYPFLRVISCNLTTQFWQSLAVVVSVSAVD